MNQKSVKSQTALACRLGAGTLILWLVSMAVVTLVSANHYLLQFSQSAENLNLFVSQRLSSDVNRHIQYDFTDYPGRFTYYLHEASRYDNSWDSYRIDESRSGHYTDEELFRQTAVIITDPSRKVLAKSGDYLYFPYVTEDIWNAHQEEEILSGYAVAHITPETWNAEGQEVLKNLSFAAEALRLTGSLADGILSLQQVEYISRGAFHNALYSTPPTLEEVDDDGSIHRQWSYIPSQFIQEQQLPWVTLYQGPETQSDTVTLYARMFSASGYSQGQPLQYKGETYPSLLALLEEAVAQWEDVYPLLTQRSVWDVTLSYSYPIYDLTHEIPLYEVFTAIHVSPMENAVRNLGKVYLGTFLVFALAAWGLLCLLKRRLLEPLAAACSAMENQENDLYPPLDQPSYWQEIQELGRQYRSIRNDLYRHRTEEVRLHKALDYAREAEENRRQMTSVIAHELKTPLAIIHSYAEALREHINEEKREQYLQVILWEVQRMDGMVLEMLDLSRLEAGKVKLARDTFSLENLVKATFDRLALASKEKGLELIFRFPEDTTVTADEARIGQVITNFAANAVRYTQQGGSITATIKKSHAGTGFYLENTCASLPEEALSRGLGHLLPYRQRPQRTRYRSGTCYRQKHHPTPWGTGGCSKHPSRSGVLFYYLNLKSPDICPGSADQKRRLRQLAFHFRDVYVPFPKRIPYSTGHDNTRPFKKLVFQKRKTILRETYRRAG